MMMKWDKFSYSLMSFWLKSYIIHLLVQGYQLTAPKLKKEPEEYG